MSKAYGLIKSTQKEGSIGKPNLTRSSIFDNESDSEDSAPNRKGLVVGPGVNERRQARKIQEKALEEDPTIFQYDELYDEIESKRDQDKNEKSKEDKKPKYIGRLLKCAERRKIENERRLERMIQKERELEGEQFKDKESFVTLSYRKKLEELRKAEEIEKREEYLEAIGDVTRQKNLDGFYRHLYEQKLGTKNEIPDKNINDKQQEISDCTQSSSKFKSTKSRMYRKRKSSFEDDTEKQSSEKEITVKKAHIQSNLDADSDFSIDSSENEDETPQIEAKSSINEDSKSKSEPEIENSIQIKKEENSTVQENEIQAQNIKKEQSDVKSVEEKDEDKSVKIDKKNIWEKRTVGEVFEEALKRYYERKALRNL